MDEVTRSVPSWSPGAGAAEASELGILFRGLTLLLLLLLELLPAWPGGVTGQPPGGRAGEGVFAAAAYEQLLGARCGRAEAEDVLLELAAGLDDASPEAPQSTPAVRDDNLAKSRALEDAGSDMLN